MLMAPAAYLLILPSAPHLDQRECTYTRLNPFTALGFRVDFSAGNERSLKVKFPIWSLRRKFSRARSSARLIPSARPHSYLAYNKYGIDFHLNPSSGLIFLNEFDFDFLGREPSGLQPKIPDTGSLVRDIF